MPVSSAECAVTELSARRPVHSSGKSLVWTPTAQGPVAGGLVLVRVTMNDVE